jgi:hypothetical protein
MEQMMERLLAEIRTNQARTDTNLKEVKPGQVEANNEKVEVLGENMWTSQKEMKSKIRALVSQMAIHEARTEVIQEEMKAKMSIN